MKGQFVYANGYSISQARNIFKFYFGDFYIKSEKNDKELRFDIYIKDKVIEDNKKISYLKDWCDVSYFNEFWNKQGKIGTNKKAGVFNVIIMQEAN